MCSKGGQEPTSRLQRRGMQPTDRSSQRRGTSGAVSGAASAVSGAAGWTTAPTGPEWAGTPTWRAGGTRSKGPGQVGRSRRHGDTHPAEQVGCAFGTPAGWKMDGGLTCAFSLYFWVGEGTRQGRWDGLKASGGSHARSKSWSASSAPVGPQLSGPGAPYRKGQRWDWSGASGGDRRGGARSLQPRKAGWYTS
jgi:hypothetical protein